jgi:hypothetical protein
LLGAERVAKARHSPRQTHYITHGLCRITKPG